MNEGITELVMVGAIPLAALALMLWTRSEAVYRFAALAFVAGMTLTGMGVGGYRETSFKLDPTGQKYGAVAGLAAGCVLQAAVDLVRRRRQSRGKPAEPPQEGED